MILNIFTDGYTPDSRLLLIAVRTHTGAFKCWTDADAFLNYFLKTDDKIVVGFNILKFDIPFLLLKMQASPRFREFFRKINYANVVDLFPILTFRNNGVIKNLEFYLEQEGIGRAPSDRDIIRNMDNEDVQGEIKKKLDAIHGLYWKLRSEK